MSDNLINNSFLSNIRELYRIVIEIDSLVLISSLAFILWFLDILFGENGAMILVLFFGAQLIYAIINQKPDSRSKEEIRKSTMRIVNIPGSFLVLFLLLNVYLKISEPLSKNFLIEVKKFEAMLSLELFLNFFSFALIFALIFLLRAFIKLLRGKIIEKNKFWKNVFMAALILVFFIASGNSNMFSSQLSEIIAFIIKCLFSFSLIFLHSTYLLRETKKAVKGRR